MRIIFNDARSEIYDAIHDSVATKADLERLEAATRTEVAGLRSDMMLRLAELEHRLSVRFASVMVVLLGLLFAALRYLPSH